MPKRWDIDRTYVMSDLHFFHENILKYDRRGQSLFTDVEQRFQLMKGWWNETVKPDDSVILLGDTCFVKEELHRLKELNGVKYLVRGNHDEYSEWRYLETAGFKRVMPRVCVAGLLFTHYPVHPIEMKRYNGNVHGHIHSEIIDDSKYLSVCAEQINYRPKLLREILEHFGLVETYADPDFVEKE